MDTSATYIQMCEKAVEIQVPMIYRDSTNFMNWGNTRSEDVWLPRQDQLQEMIKSKYQPYYLWTLFASYEYDHLHNLRLVACNFKTPIWLEHCKSWEQLWLAFVMKERYNKIWSGTDWELDKIN